MANEGSLQGFRELSRKLARLGPALGGKTLRSAAFTSTTPVIKTARVLIPKNDRDFLKRTYKGRPVAPGFASRNIARRSKFNRDKSIVWVNIGVRPEAFYAVHFVEVGTSRQAKQPWLEPAFRQHRQTIVNNMGDKLRKKLFLEARKR